jgi:ssDNA-binding Zn-finger/Zn-ribbon topoisomerase 1
MAKVKYRKCPECGGKMMVRKSGKGNKFWGCTMYRETGCTGGGDYHGNGARAGLNLNIREIENGYIITTVSPYAGVDDDPVELHVKEHKDLSDILKGLFEMHIESLCKEIADSTEFTDEINTEKHEKRVETVKRGTPDVDVLLKRMAEARKKAEAGVD